MKKMCQENFLLKKIGKTFLLKNFIHSSELFERFWSFLHRKREIITPCKCATDCGSYFDLDLGPLGPEVARQKCWRLKGKTNLGLPCETCTTLTLLWNLVLGLFVRSQNDFIMLSFCRIRINAYGSISNISPTFNYLITPTPISNVKIVGKMCGDTFLKTFVNLQLKWNSTKRLFYLSCFSKISFIDFFWK